MEVGKPKCCEGLKFIAKSTETKTISLPAKLLLHYCILRARRGFPFLGRLRSRLGEGDSPWGGGVRLNLTSSAAARHSSKE
jgi:hypothetical protein